MNEESARGWFQANLFTRFTSQRFLKVNEFNIRHLPDPATCGLAYPLPSTQIYPPLPRQSHPVNTSANMDAYQADPAMRQQPRPIQSHCSPPSTKAFRARLLPPHSSTSAHGIPSPPLPPRPFPSSESPHPPPSQPLHRRTRRAQRARHAGEVRFAHPQQQAATNA